MAARRGLIGGLAALIVAEAVGAVVLSAVAGWDFAKALDSFVVSNVVLGLSFGLCGALVAWHRPSNPVGWLLTVAGLLHGLTAVTSPVAELLVENDAADSLVRATETVILLAWPWAIAVCLPLFLMLFPDGRLVSPAWRWAVVAVVLTAPAFAFGDWTSDPIEPGYPTPYLSLPSGSFSEALGVFGEIRTLAAILLGVLALGVRYRRAEEVERRQIQWLLLAGVVVLAFITPWSLVAGTPAFVLFSIPLIPAAVAVAIVRHGLLDIRVVLSRVLAWALLSGVVVLLYVVLVGMLDAFVSERLGRSAVATVLIALAVAPILPRLQREVDKLMYGDRRDPARVISLMGERLTGEGLPAVVGSLRASLRVPYVGLRVEDTVVAEDGTPPDATGTLPLEYGGRAVGKLVVGLRPGERELSGSDRAALRLVAVPLALAVELQDSRDRLAAAREDERGRVRRDLHDGLGPHLTGVAMKADAARNLVGSDPDRAIATIEALGKDTRAAIVEVRRVIDGLRPVALDELGLVGALREHVQALSSVGPVHVSLELPERLPTLPRAVEVAAYRVATEALNNVVRHAGAGAATVRLRAGACLDVEVLDDGDGGRPWVAGVGLRAMAARATELGGSFEAGPLARGGRVAASFPLVAS